jgi:hypothetical protein
VIRLTTLITIWAKFSGRDTLPAATVRARWVLMHGCPVVSVHFSPGLARHIGQRTDNICRSESVAVFTLRLFDLDRPIDGELCSFDLFSWGSGTESGIDLDTGIQSDLRPESPQNRTVPVRMLRHSFVVKGASFSSRVPPF